MPEQNQSTQTIPTSAGPVEVTIRAFNEMPVRELVEAGYLQEVNRQFFHPLGLALVVAKPTDPASDDPWTIVGIRDCRDDPEGILYGPEDPPDRARAERVMAEQAARATPRVEALQRYYPHHGSMDALVLGRQSLTALAGAYPKHALDVVEPLPGPDR